MKRIQKRAGETNSLQKWIFLTKMPRMICCSMRLSGVPCAVRVTGCPQQRAPPLSSPTARRTTTIELGARVAAEVRRRIFDRLSRRESVRLVTLAATVFQFRDGIVACATVRVKAASDRMLKPVLQDAEFLADVADARADLRNLHLWWIGQSGFLVQWRDRPIGR